MKIRVPRVVLQHVHAPLARQAVAHFVFCLLALIPAVSFAQGESSAALYNRANSMYAQGEFGRAIELYQKALEGGFDNARVEYNLANAYLKKNPPDLGLAILHFKRAKRLDPRDADIRYNLQYANTLIKGKLPQAERSFLQRGWDKLLTNIASGEALAALSVLYWILMAASIAFMLSRNRGTRRAMTWIGALALLLMIFQAPVTWASLNRASQTKAVVLEDELPVRSGPGVDNPELFKLFEGMVVERHDCRKGWCQVAVPGGLAGWIPDEKAEKI